ncbi:MAG: dual specificity protein phosphatase family protein [Pseudomonadales bacterium]
MNYLITRIGEGSLHAMAAPKPLLLHNHIRYLKMQGVTKVLCLMEPIEMERLGLDEEEQWCLSEGLKYENFPITDHSVTSISDVKPLAKRLLQEIKSGEHLVVHCYAGIGRTGMICCCILMENGLTAGEAIAITSEKRQLKVPETREQTEFVLTYPDS